MKIKRPILMFLVMSISGIITIYNGIKPLDKIIILSVVFFMVVKLFIKNKLKIITIIILILFYVLSIFRFILEKNYFDNIDKQIDKYNNKIQTIEATINGIGQSKNSFYFDLINTKVENFNLYKTKCYFSDENNLRLKIGQKILINGVIYESEDPMNFGEYNNKNYMRSIKQTCSIYANNIILINNNFNIIYHNIYLFRQKIKLQIFKIFNKKNAGLFNAMLTGDKSSLQFEQKKLFSDSGIAHILAISGLHLSIIGMAIFEMLRKKFTIKTSAFIVSIIIILYAIFIDASYVTMRAIIMLFIRFFSLSIGRTYDSKNSLYFVALFFILFSPYLIFNAGFQFSYICVFSLNYGYQFDSKIMYKIRLKIYKFLNKEINNKNLKMFKIPANVIITFFIFPITIYHYFDYPLYSIFINLIIIPLMSLVLIFGIIGVLLSFINIYVGIFFVGIVHYIFEFYEIVCVFFEKMPYSILNIGRPNFTFIIFFYMLLFLLHFYLAPQYIKNNKKFVKKNIDYTKVIISLFCLLFLFVIINIHYVKNLKFTSLYIGQGDSFIIQNKDYVFTIDGGSTSNKNAGEYILAPHLKSQAIKNIEIAFISHGDEDHKNAIEYIMREEENINIKNIVLPIMAKDNKKYNELKKTAKDRNVNIIYLKAGDKLKYDNIEIYVINPFENDETAKADINEQSLCFKFVYKNKTILFTGDIGNKIEYQMINNDTIKQMLKSDILKVAHHGSKNSNTLEFLEIVDPIYSVISSGIKNRYNHPHIDTIKKLEKIGSHIIKTAESGEIDMYLSEKDINVKTYKKKY